MDQGSGTVVRQIQSSTTDFDTSHPPCCISKYHEAKKEAYEFYQQVLKVEKNLQRASKNLLEAEVINKQLRSNLESTELEVERARMANEDTNQNFLQLQQYLIWLEEAKKRSEQSEKNAIVFSEDVSKQVAGLHNGRHVSDIVLHLSSSLQIIDAMSGRYTEEDMVSRLKFALDQTNDLQRCITDLEHELEDKSRAYEQKLENKSKAYEQELENKGNEIATLKKAHEILLEDKPRRKQTRRGKPKPQVVK